MKYKKIIRKKDNRVFYILNDEFLCSSNMTVLKTLDAVKEFTDRFRYFIDGYDDLKNKYLNTSSYDGNDNYKVWEQ